MKIIKILAIVGVCAIAICATMFLTGSTLGTGADVETLPENFTIPIDFNTPEGGMLQLTNVNFLMRHDSGYFQFGSGAFDPNTGEMQLRFGPAILKTQAQDSLSRIQLNLTDAQLARDEVITNFLGN